MRFDVSHEQNAVFPRPPSLVPLLHLLGQVRSVLCTFTSTLLFLAGAIVLLVFSNTCKAPRPSLQTKALLCACVVLFDHALQIHKLALRLPIRPEAATSPTFHRPDRATAALPATQPPPPAAASAAPWEAFLESAAFFEEAGDTLVLAAGQGISHVTTAKRPMEPLRPLSEPGHVDIAASGESPLNEVAHNLRLPRILAGAVQSPNLATTSNPPAPPSQPLSSRLFDAALRLQARRSRPAPYQKNSITSPEPASSPSSGLHAVCPVPAALQDPEAESTPLDVEHDFRPQPNAGGGNCFWLALQGQIGAVDEARCAVARWLRSHCHPASGRADHLQAGGLVSEWEVNATVQAHPRLFPYGLLVVHRPTQSFIAYAPRSMPRLLRTKPPPLHSDRLPTLLQYTQPTPETLGHFELLGRIVHEALPPPPATLLDSATAAQSCPATWLDPLTTHVHPTALPRNATPDIGSCVETFLDSPPGPVLFEMPAHVCPPPPSNTTPQSGSCPATLSDSAVVTVDEWPTASPQLPRILAGMESPATYSTLPPQAEGTFGLLRNMGVPAATAHQAAMKHPDDINAALDWACSSQPRHNRPRSSMSIPSRPSSPQGLAPLCLDLRTPEANEGEGQVVAPQLNTEALPTGLQIPSSWSLPAQIQPMSERVAAYWRCAREDAQAAANALYLQEITWATQHAVDISSRLLDGLLSLPTSPPRSLNTSA